MAAVAATVAAGIVVPAVVGVAVAVVDIAVAVADIAVVEVEVVAGPLVLHNALAAALGLGPLAILACSSARFDSASLPSAVQAANSLAQVAGKMHCSLHGLQRNYSLHFLDFLRVRCLRILVVLLFS